MTHPALAVIALVALAACSSKASPPAPRSADGDAGAAPASADAATRAGAPEDAGARPVRLAVSRVDVDAFVERWLATQNGGDFAAYGALYADDFRGVRRSGTQTVRMDRTRWLADRKRMFARPMQVSVRDPEVTLAPRGAQIRFTQEWASGSYHDVGPKQLSVELADGSGDALRIVREEMLASKVVKRGSGDADASGLHVTIDDTIVLSLSASPDWGTGKPRLKRGEIPQRDPRCDDDPPDYEKEQERYWGCQRSDRERASEYFVAIQEVDPSRLPATLAAWKGQRVRMGGPRARCEAVVSGFRLRAERTTVLRNVLDHPGGPAAGVIATGRPVLLAILDSGCPGNWATLASAPAPAPWTVSSLLEPGVHAVATAAFSALKRLDDYPEFQPEIWVGAPFIRTFEKGERRFVIASQVGNVGCQEAQAITAVFQVSGSDAKPRLALLFYDRDWSQFIDAVDSDGDDWPELVSGSGILARREGAYERVVDVDFPDEIAQCHCECE